MLCFQVSAYCPTLGIIIKHVKTSKQHAVKKQALFIVLALLTVPMEQ